MKRTALQMQTDTVSDIRSDLQLFYPIEQLVKLCYTAQPSAPCSMAHYLLVMVSEWEMRTTHYQSIELVSS